MTDSYAVGIDLGTTFTAAAIHRAGGTEMVNLGAAAAAVPSVMTHTENGWVYGEAASDSAAQNPLNVARNFKRRIGDPVPIRVAGNQIAAEELSAQFMQWVLGKVVERQSQPPTTVALTHPANWGQYRLELFKSATKLVADCAITLVPEPHAAAAHYASRESLDDGGVVCVYDLGGGTFDCCLLRKTSSGVGFEQAGQAQGLASFGGVDLDADLARFVLEHADVNIDELDHDDPILALAMAGLRRDITQAKRVLSEVSSATVNIILPSVSTQVRITRREFEDLVRPRLLKTVDVTVQAIGQAGLEPVDVDRVLLVGGSSRVPLVAQLLAEALGRPIAVDADPKHAVALGAATIAAGDILGLLPQSVSGAPHESGGTTTVDSGPEVRDSAETRAKVVSEILESGSGNLELGQSSSATDGVAAVVDVGSSPDRSKDGPSGSTGQGPIMPSAARLAGAPQPPIQTPLTAYADLAVRSKPRWLRLRSWVEAVVIVGVVFGVWYLVTSIGEEASDGAEVAITTEVESTQSGGMTLEQLRLADWSVAATIKVGDRPTGIAIADDDVWVTNQEDNTISVIGRLDRVVTDTIAVGASPVAVTVANGRAWVVNQGDRTVSVVDLESKKVVDSISVGFRAVAIIAAHDRIWVVNQSESTISVIDPADHTVVETIKVGFEPSGIVSDSDRIWVSNRQDNTVSVVDPANNSVVETIQVADRPLGVAVIDDVVWVTHTNERIITLIDSDSGLLPYERRVLTIDFEVGRGAVAAGEKLVFVVDPFDSSLSIVDATNAEVLETVRVGDEAAGVAVADNIVWVAHSGSGTVKVIEPS